MQQINNLFVTAARGLEAQLVQELKNLGLSEVRETPSGASCRGDLAQAYRVCLWSRVASRVLWHLKDFPAATPEELYEGMRTINWSKHMSCQGRLAIGFTSRRSKLRHSQFGAQKAKDAIVDQFRAREGERPSVDLEQPDIRVSVHVDRDQASVALDLSGDSLHRRGYRLDTVKAPLKETLAAGLLLRAGWPEIAARGGPFVDLFCGSGTLPIEAAMIAGDVAPGLLHEHWGFSGWLQHQPELWQTLLEEAEQRREAGLQKLPPIQGYDIDRHAVRAAMRNVEVAGLEAHVHIERQDFLQVTPPGRTGQPGLVVTNPPYGERLGDEAEILQQYGKLGELLKDRFLGWQVAVLAANPEHGFALGLRAGKPPRLFNGPIECLLIQTRVQADKFFVPKGESGSRHQQLFRQARQLVRDGLPESATMLANRLRKNLRHLGRWARRNDVNAYRLYDADLPEFAFALDIYHCGEQRFLVMQEYQAPATIEEEKATARLVEAIAVVPQVLEVPPEQLFLKIRQKQKGAAQYLKQDARGHFHEVREGSARLLVNFEDYLDTGLFLDHRQTRQMVAAMSAGKSILNLFCYTGSVTVQAALGGAAETTSVDLSRTYLAWAKRNLALNGLDTDAHQLIEADCVDWLARQAYARKLSYDLIFLDPPTFSNSKSMKENFDVQTQHPELLRNCLTLLAPGGVLLFSTNFRKFRLDESVLAGTDWQEISSETLPEDFARRGRIHRCWRIRKAR